MGDLTHNMYVNVFQASCKGKKKQGISKLLLIRYLNYLFWPFILWCDRDILHSEYGILALSTTYCRSNFSPIWYLYPSELFVTLVQTVEVIFKDDLYSLKMTSRGSNPGSCRCRLSPCPCARHFTHLAYAWMWCVREWLLVVVGWRR